ncbi:MAG: hypothetical protein EOP86_22425 [Verrucomicrobiaceae bacterium]|nr:MAG: hypothetical protein EOP86_22425 [Verrucomicrobiaceae bacterium]
MSTRQMNLREFCEHAQDTLQEMEKNQVLLELVRDGQVIAYVSPAAKPKGNTGTMADWLGAGAGFQLAPGCRLEDPAFEPGDWEDFPNADD